MIKFIYEEDKPDCLVFDDVVDDQFFVYDGELYQKISDGLAQRICGGNGLPHATGDISFERDEIIDRILPKVSKIEF